MSGKRAERVPGQSPHMPRERQRLSPPVSLDPERLAADQAAWLERSRAAWDARAERWDARAELNAGSLDRAPDLDRMWTALGLHRGARLLDAGCGSGQFAIAFAARGAAVTGVDLSPEMIRRAQRHAAEHGVAVTWRVEDLARLAALTAAFDAAFDAVFARVLLPFVPDIPATLRVLRRVLKPGGKLLASVPGALSPIYSASWSRHLPGGDPGNNYLLPWELERLLLVDGWQIVDGWGEWGDDLYGTVNDLSAAGRDLSRQLQQATATTWTTIAVS
jgi:SAM-dependent methyltransferase